MDVDLSSNKGCTMWSKIDPLLCTHNKALLMGERSRGSTRWDVFIDVLEENHWVQYGVDAGRDPPPCCDKTTNPVCNCTRFRHLGILCSQVLELSHFLDEISMHYLLADISGVLATHQEDKGWNGRREGREERGEGGEGGRGRERERAHGGRGKVGGRRGREKRGGAG